MLASILVTGIALGSVYALIGVTYNVMFAASRVMSFTTGQVGMLGGVLGAMFVMQIGLPWPLGLLLTLAGCALFGVLTELLAVRPVLAALDKHLYVLSTLALALMVQQATAIWWGTEPRPFPRLAGFGIAGVEERFWLPPVACALAPSIPVLTATRGLQGLAGAAGVVISRAVVRDLFDGPAVAAMMSRLSQPARHNRSALPSTCRRPSDGLRSSWAGQ